MPKFTKENASEMGSKGQKRSAETKRNKRNARESAAMLMHMAATGSIKQAMKSLGYEESESTYLNGIMAKLYMMAMDGDLEAMDRLMKISGYDPEENRKEAESVAMIKQKNVELQIRVKELEMKMKQTSGIDVDESSEDVMIYLPAVETETDLEDINKEFEEQFPDPVEEEFDIVSVQMDTTSVEA